MGCQEMDVEGEGARMGPKKRELHELPIAININCKIRDYYN